MAQISWRSPYLGHYKAPYCVSGEAINQGWGKSKHHLCRSYVGEQEPLESEFAAFYGQGMACYSAPGNSIRTELELKGAETYAVK